MADKAKAAEAKAKGNTAFSAQNYEEGIKHFTEAISHDSSDHVFFSNRSACYASLNKYEKAYEDGKECVKLKPDWAKGYTRKGLAEYWLKKYDDSAETYKAGLKLAPEDAALKEGLKKAMDAKYEVAGSGAGAGGGGGGGGGGFGQMDMSKLTAAATKNPKIAEYMQDKQLMSQVNMILQLGAQNPQMQQQIMMQMVQQDMRLLEIIMALQGMDPSDAEGLMAGKGEGKGSSAPAAAPKKAEPKKAEPPPDLRDDATKEADEWKTKGNELYKKKNFKEAIEMYDKAIAAQPNDLVYHNNKCAVWVEMGEYDQVLEKCRDLLERRYEINGANSGGASFEKVAKVYTRMGGVYEKKKEFEKAIEFYNKALCEDNNKTTRNALRELEKQKEKHEKDSYMDSAKAEEANERAKEFFKATDWPNAKKEYDEAVARNPKDAKLYCNRAAALTKLMAYPDALRDLDECIKIDPKYQKAYSRKGAAHFFMKEYNKALKAYDDGLKVDPDNEECKNGRDQVHAKVMENSRSGEVDEEQVAHAMADPEIQQIMHDPQINMLLKQMQENPKEASKILQKDAKMAEAFNKLVTAGIVRVG